MLPSLAIDLDGVVADFNTAMLGDYNALPEVQAGTVPGLLMSQLNYNFEQLDPAIFTRLRTIFNTPGFFLKLKPLPNAIEILTRFRDNGFPSIICTAPTRDHNNLINGKSADEKFSWVQQHLPLCGNDIMVTKDKFYTGTDMLIDDYPPNITLWCEQNPNGVGYLVDQSWNQGIKHYPINCARGSLAQVLTFIDDFWCETRGIFAYRLDELEAWR